MCLDCGCNKPDDRHGDDRHMIMQDFVDAAKVNKKPVDQTFQTVEKTVQQVLDGKLKSSAMQSA